MMSGRPQPGRAGERGSAVVAALVLLAAALLVVVGARFFGRAAVEELRCQGEAVRAIGSAAAPRCGSAGSASAALTTIAPAPEVARFSPSTDPGTSSLPGPQTEETATLAQERDSELDRARETLAPLFQVVEGVSAHDPPVSAYGAIIESLQEFITGPTAPNQVSEEDFEWIVRLYSDIREKRTSIQPMRSALPYWDGMMRDLARILQSEGGREVVRRLARHQDHTFLAPGLRRNAAGEVDPALGLEPTEARTEFVTSSQVLLTYAPGEWVRIPDADLTRDPWAVTRSDVVLYHELIHVLDFHNETIDVRTLEEYGEPVYVIEFRAVGIGPYRNHPISENAYRAARRAIAKLGIGAEPGDTDMPHRPHYLHRLRPADPPGPRPPPTAGD